MIQVISIIWNRSYMCKMVQPLFLNHNLFINHLKGQNKHCSVVEGPVVIWFKNAKKLCRGIDLRIFIPKTAEENDASIGEINLRGNVAFSTWGLRKEMYGLSQWGSKKSIRGIPLWGFLCGSLSRDKALHRSVVLFLK